ncbi:MAG: DUF1858 domain-containing protein [Candidatus Nanoarchaeia archaeon]|nr:DUF1858 domain-containing protein [Candidatus Nanoarchaeia archaeon]MDD5741623.1 DUF1858 domain-containing protein [Candidatus Nanoarchaeia archaeon]
MKKTKTKKKITKSKSGITKEMSFSEIIEKHPEAAGILFESGMHCCGCPMSADESLEQGAKAHGIKVDELLKKLNKNK